MNNDTIRRHELLRSEKVRLATFEGWTGVANPRVLAANGFYRNAGTEFTSCFACETMLFYWETTDHPSSIHRAAAKDCPFIKGLDCSIPISLRDVGPLEPQQIEEIATSKPAMSLCSVNNGMLTRDIRPIFLNSLVSVIVPKPETAGALLNVSAFFEVMKLRNHRHYTFDRYHGTTFFDKPIYELLDDGFFCLADGASVQCHACRCILRNWTRNESVSERHRLIAPHCPIVKSREPKPAVTTKEVTCPVCLDKRPTTAMIPCGHVVCEPCFDQVDSRCPTCRDIIAASLRIYI